jgi:hypothetical protein
MLLLLKLFLISLRHLIFRSSASAQLHRVIYTLKINNSRNNKHSIFVFFCASLIYIHTQVFQISTL